MNCRTIDCYRHIQFAGSMPTYSSLSCSTLLHSHSIVAGGLEVMS
jgi:hypothetical protein